MDRRRFLLLGTSAALFRRTSPAAAEPAPPFTTLFYRSGSLRIEAYLYRPSGEGPFPLIVYNHGSRFGEDRRSYPFRFIGALFGAAGYAVLVPERRGYGSSDGRTFAQEVGTNKDAAFIGRLQRETDDVLAALDALSTVPFVDRNRLGIAGWSFGGIVTLFAAARSAAFRVVLDQAGGAINWDRSPMLRAALLAAASEIRAPVLLTVAANDASTEAITALAETRERAGLPQSARIYPAFTPKANRWDYPPGHLLFGADGAGIWGAEAVSFFDGYLKAR